MIIGKDMEAIDGLPIIYLGSIKALAISDLHLGFEGGMAKAGVAIPKANLKSITAAFESALRGRKVERVMIVGDVKNDFSSVNAEELRELREIVGMLSARGVSLEMVRGNHDNFIERHSNALGMRVYPKQALVGGYLFAHGDERLLKADGEVKVIIIGHEHPTISIRSRAGTAERLRCFLNGQCKYFGKPAQLVVLPAAGYFETGSDINNRGRSRIMSPILKTSNVDEMEAIAIGDGATLNFGRIKYLRDIEI